MPQWFVWTVLAKGQLRAIDRATAKRILDALNRLRWGQGDIRPLPGFDPPRKRLRVGDYRIMYREVDEQHFEILEVGHRSEVYKG